jgi:predicted  nucleic acid-binding Zn-ribbon protein
MQATNFFGNARKSEVHNHYYGLTADDLEELSFWGYFKVAVFLLGILIFWIFCGWLASYSLPFPDIIKLLFSCFNGKMPEELIHIQRELQQRTFSRNQEDGNLISNYSKAQLILGIFERLDVEDVELKFKIGKTAKAVRIKKEEIFDLLPEKIQNNRDGFIGTQDKIFDYFKARARYDYDLLDSIFKDIFHISHEVKISAIDRVSANEHINQKIEDAREYFNPVRFDLLDHLSEAVESILGISVPVNSRTDALEARIREIAYQKSGISKKFQDLVEEKKKLSYSLEKIRLVNHDLEGQLSAAREELVSLKNKIGAFRENHKRASEQLDAKSEGLSSLSIENSNLKSRIRSLERIINQKVQESESLKEKLNDLVEKRFSGVNAGRRRRSLEGRFIGNIEKSASKFHFDFNCPNYWGLVGQYLYSSDSKAISIITRDNPSDFYEAGLEPCSKCAKNDSET